MSDAHTSGNDMPAHNAGYASFIGWVKIGAAACAAIAALVVFIISR